MSTGLQAGHDRNSPVRGILRNLPIQPLFSNGLLQKASKIRGG
jgi:hypothetical protein